MQLDARLAPQFGYTCQGCGERVCFRCGCTERFACITVSENKTKTSKTTTTCSWSAIPDLCSTCYSQVAAEAYADATEDEESSLLIL
jgi:hypothetical protein